MGTLVLQPSTGGENEKDSRNISSPQRVESSQQLDARDQTKMYIDQRIDRNPILSLNAKFVDNNNVAEIKPDLDHGIGKNRSELVSSHKEYSYRPDNSKRLRQDILSSRARVEEVLNYTPSTAGAKKARSSGWAPSLNQRQSYASDRYRSDGYFSSSFQARTPELKNWLRGGR